MNATSLDELTDNIWQLLEEGARDRRSPMHVPVVATIDRNGAPDQRVMVLRHADRVAAKLRFHTDARSPKIAHAKQNSAVHILAYHPERKIQLRIGGYVRILANGGTADAAWAASTRFARRCYLADAAPGNPLPVPGSGLPGTVEGREPNEVEIAGGRQNFALLTVEVTAIDWLHLANSGHRRAQLWREGAGWAGQWVVP